jgi:hypothetical protein
MPVTSDASTLPAVGGTRLEGRESFAQAQRRALRAARRPGPEIDRRRGAR